MMMVMVTGFVIVIVIGVMVITTGRGRGEAALGEVGDQGFQGCARGAGAHADASPGETFQSAVSDAAGDHGVNSVFAEPPGEQSRLMFGGVDDLRVGRAFGVRVEVDQGELPATAEVGV